MQAAFKGPEISIHALLAESDDVVSDTDKLYYVFLSTLSLRRATQLLQGPSRDFYPRSPCGERRYWPCVHVVGRSISIHALLAESDTDEVLTNDEQTISIHALLAESDNADTKTPHFTNYFYPRSPCGERLRKVPILGIK